MSIQKQVLAAVEATAGTMTDDDQRSAIGMARSWVNNGKDVKRQVYFLAEFKRRDDLAEALVEIVRGSDPDECVEALAAARRVINAPFIDESMLGWQASRAVRGMIGSAKKTEKMESGK